MTTLHDLLHQISESSTFLTREEIRHRIIKELQLSDISLEFGVFTGGSINYFAAACPKNIFYGYDSFEGLPEKWNDLHPAGHFKTDISKLRFHPNVIIKQGWFSDTLEPSLQELELNKIKFIHIDCDIYSSTSYILNTLLPKLNQPIMVLFDEFINYMGFENHEIKAFLEFVNSTNTNYKIIGHNIRHQQVLILLNP